MRYLLEKKVMRIPDDLNPIFGEMRFGNRAGDTLFDVFVHWLLVAQEVPCAWETNDNLDTPLDTPSLRCAIEIFLNERAGWTFAMLKSVNREIGEAMRHFTENVVTLLMDMLNEQFVVEIKSGLALKTHIIFLYYKALADVLVDTGEGMLVKGEFTAKHYERIMAVALSIFFMSERCVGPISSKEAAEAAEADRPARSMYATERELITERRLPDVEPENVGSISLPGAEQNPTLIVPAIKVAHRDAGKPHHIERFETCGLVLPRRLIEVFRFEGYEVRNMSKSELPVGNGDIVPIHIDRPFAKKQSRFRHFPNYESREVYLQSKPYVPCVDDMARNEIIGAYGRDKLEQRELLGIKRLKPELDTALANRVQKLGWQ